MANEINNCQISLNYKDVVAVFHFTMSSLSLSSHWKNTFTFLQLESSLLLSNHWKNTFTFLQLGDHFYFATTGRSLSHHRKITFTQLEDHFHFPTTGRSLSLSHHWKIE